MYSPQESKKPCWNWKYGLIWLLAGMGYNDDMFLMKWSEMLLLFSESETD